MLGGGVTEFHLDGVHGGAPIDRKGQASSSTSVVEVNRIVLRPPGEIVVTENTNEKLRSSSVHSCRRKSTILSSTMHFLNEFEPSSLHHSLRVHLNKLIRDYLSILTMF